jgi:hypothetical protein
MIVEQGKRERESKGKARGVSECRDKEKWLEELLFSCCIMENREEVVVDGCIMC